MWYIILLVVWAIGAFVTYHKYINRWKQGKAEKIYYSILWPLVLPLYGIYCLHNKM